MPAAMTASEADAVSIPEDARQHCRAIQPAGLDRAVLYVDADEVAEIVAAATVGWELSEVPLDRARPLLAVTRVADGYVVLSGRKDDEPTAYTAVAAACNVLVDIAVAWINRDPQSIALHCGAVELGGALVVLAGAARMGKSTLTARLAAEDLRVYCDDILPMAGDSLNGIALGIAPRPRMPLPADAPLALADHVARYCVASDARYAYVAGPGLAPHGATAPVRTVLLLDRRDGAVAGLRRATPVEAVRALLAQNLLPDRDPEVVFARMLALMEQCDVFWLDYADLDEAADLIVSTFGAGDDARLDGLADAPPALADPQSGPAVPVDVPAAPTLSRHRLRARPEVSVRQVAEDAFLCDRARGAVLHLNAVGRAVWALLGEGTSPAEAAELLAEAYPEVTPERIAADVDLLFAELAAAGLVEPA
jgi:hypothetical protein